MLTKALSRVFSFGLMAPDSASPGPPDEMQPDEMPERAERAVEAPPTVEEAKELGLRVEREYGFNLRSEGEPSGPTTPQVDEKRPASRFARVAADTTNGELLDS